MPRAAVRIHDEGKKYMNETTTNPPPREKFCNIHLFRDVPTYRLPLGGIVSILHRVSGVALFFFMPFIIWLFDTSITSEFSFGRFLHIFDEGCWILPGFIFKVIALGLLWAFFHHLFAGLRHVWMDVTHCVSKQQGHTSAVWTVLVSLGLTLLMAGKVFGLY